MNSHQITLFFHLLAACVWVGGHLILLFRFVPAALKQKSLNPINSFRKKFEPIGIPSLLILIISGIIMAYDYEVTVGSWFLFSTGIERVVSLKLILISITVLSAFLATRFIFPNLKDKVTPLLVFFIALVTVIAVTLVFLGTTVRYGGI